MPSKDPIKDNIRQEISDANEAANTTYDVQSYYKQKLRMRNSIERVFATNAKNNNAKTAM